MSEDDRGDKGRPPPGTTVQPVLVEVPLFTLAELREFERLADETAGLAVRLRSKARYLQRVIQAAEARWPATKQETPAQRKETPELRLVDPTTQTKDGTS